MSERYPVPAARRRIETVISRSRFITTIGPVPDLDAARAFVEAVRTEFAGATHNCWAYLVGPPASTAQVGLSDDREPSGTAGKPMLQVLLGSGIGDVAVVVTRYYGGVKLGTGGLVRAYAGGVKEALDGLELIEKVQRVDLAVTLPYRLYESAQRLLPDFEATTAETDFAVDVTLRLVAPVDRVDALRAALRELSAGRARFAGDHDISAT